MQSHIEVVKKSKHINFNDDNDTVVGIVGSDLHACFDSLLPFPPNDSGKFFFDLLRVNIFFPVLWHDD
jgi:hypothetical protein